MSATTRILAALLTLLMFGLMGCDKFKKDEEESTTAPEEMQPGFYPVEGGEIMPGHPDYREPYYDDMPNSFSLDLGQVTGGDGSVTLTDAEAVALTLTDVSLFAGVGGSLNDEGTPDDYSDDTVNNGTIGFAGSITGDLDVVAIKAGTDTYLGIQTQPNAITAVRPLQGGAG